MCDILAYNKELNNDTIVWHPGDNTKKIWAHRLLEKPKTVSAEGLGKLQVPRGSRVMLC